MAKDKFYDNRDIPAVKKAFYISGKAYNKLMRVAHLNKVSASRQLVILIDASPEEEPHGGN